MKGAQKWVLNELTQITQEVLKTITSKTNLKSLEYGKRKTPTKLSAIERQSARYKNENSALPKKYSFIQIRAVELESLCVYGDDAIGSLELDSESLIKLVIFDCPFVSFDQSSIFII